MLSETLHLLPPEITLIAVAVLIYMGGAFVASRDLWRWVALGGLYVAGLLLAVCPGGPALKSPLEMDLLANYIRWLSLFSGLVLVLLAWQPLAGGDTPEYFGSLVLIVSGLMLVGSARDLVVLLLGLELVSIPTYLVLYVGRRDAASQEAAAKYFYLSILASALFLYGLSFLYGAAGSMDLRQVQARLADADRLGSFLWFARIGLMLMFGGLGFRIAAVPFHFYAPDVYQGTTHAGAGLLSVAPKIAGFVVLVRVVAVAMPGVHSAAWPVAMVLAVLTMSLGNVLALWQDNLRRLLAYSSIAHAGYMLIGLSVFMAPHLGAEDPWNGIGALLFYLLVYAAATLGTFAALACLGSPERELDHADQLAGLAWTGGPIRPALAWAIALFLLSLAGIPPLAGFWGKLAIFASCLSVGRLQPAARPWFVALALIGLVNSAVAAAYYLRIVGVLFFRQPSQTPKLRGHAGGTLLAVVLCAAVVVLVGLAPGARLREANRSSPRPLLARHQTAQIGPTEKPTVPPPPWPMPAGADSP
ncbi:MAG: NADH-quinone oxidoreductase subunit N [Thermoguttaceae bacterium]